MMNHDLHCPCLLCDEARQAYQRYVAEHDPHAKCTSLKTMCPACLAAYRAKQDALLDALDPQAWADYLNEALGNKPDDDDEPDTEI
jgi:hypothetical protein